jgi:hypothetical protein
MDEQVWQGHKGMGGYAVSLGSASCSSQLTERASCDWRTAKHVRWAYIDHAHALFLRMSYHDCLL